MHCHCGTNNRAPRWTFMNSCKPEVRPGAREESVSPAWLAVPAMNACDTTKGTYGGLTLDVDQHYIGSVTAATHQEKGIITLESNPSRGTVQPAPHGKGNKCNKNVKYKRADVLSLRHQQLSTTVDIHGPLQTRSETYTLQYNTYTSIQGSLTIRPFLPHGLKTCWSIVQLSHFY